jgi:small membrane protein
VLLIQVFVVAFALFAMSRVVLRFKRHSIGRIEGALWFAFWAATFAVGIHPDVTYKLAAFLGVGRGVDAVSYVTLIALCYLAFRQQVMMKNLEQQLTELVRKLALEKPERQR